MDKLTNQSKGFAFVEMQNDNEAHNAIKELDGYGLDGRKIGVSVAKPREDRQSNNRNNFRSDNSGRSSSFYSRGNYRK